MYIQAVETDLDMLDIPVSELFDLLELREFRIILENKMGQAESGKTIEKLADMAGVSEKTYRMGAKVLDSDNETWV